MVHIIEQQQLLIIHEITSFEGQFLLILCHQALKIETSIIVKDGKVVLTLLPNRNKKLVILCKQNRNSVSGN